MLQACFLARVLMLNDEQLQLMATSATSLLDHWNGWKSIRHVLRDKNTNT